MPASERFNDSTSPGQPVNTPASLRGCAGFSGPRCRTDRSGRVRDDIGRGTRIRRKATFTREDRDRGRAAWRFGVRRRRGNRTLGAPRETGQYAPLCPWRCLTRGTSRHQGTCIGHQRTRNPRELPTRVPTARARVSARFRRGYRSSSSPSIRTPESQFTVSPPYAALPAPQGLPAWTAERRGMRAAAGVLQVQNQSG